MHSSRIRNILNTILILAGLVLFIIFGSKAASQATNWQAVNGKRHSLPSPSSLVTTAAFIASNQQAHDSQAQPEAVNSQSAEAVQPQDTQPADDNQVKAPQPQTDQPASRGPNSNSGPGNVPPANHKNSMQDD